MKALMIVTSHAQLGDTGQPTGFWLEELAAPYAEFRAAGGVQRVDARAGAVAQQPPPDSREGEPDRVLVEAAEPLDRPLVIHDGEATERGVLTVDPI